MSIERVNENKSPTGYVADDPQECDTCPQKDVLTAEEESILKEMRSIKDELRPMNRRLSQLEEKIKAPALGATSDERNEEWAKLEGRVSELREEWTKWSEKLDQAIEQKLICLGHR